MDGPRRLAGMEKSSGILLRDAASKGERGTVILEARGVPMGYRSRSALEAMIRPFETFHLILLERVKAGAY